MVNEMYSPVLVLNASYEPLHICAARRAFVLLVKDAATVLEDRGRAVAGIPFPTVIRLRDMKRVPHRVQKLSRANLLMRDGFRCQYCAVVFKASALTLDHVLPRAQGGQSTWENLVACCSPCNHKKGNQTPEVAGMALLRRPRPVTIHTARGILRAHGEYESAWRPYLYYDNAGSSAHVMQG